MPTRGTALYTSGVKSPCAPLDRGLSCLRRGIRGISDAELLGMGLGLGERGGLELCDAVREIGGFGNMLSTDGGAP